jgi:hypothetical protein
MNKFQNISINQHVKLVSKSFHFSNWLIYSFKKSNKVRIRIRVVQVKQTHAATMPIMPGNLFRGVLMLHNNARPHAAHATRDTLRRFGWGVLDHPRVTITCLGPWRRLWRAGGSWGSGTVVHSATRVLCGGYNETCAALGQVPKEWWSACLVLPSVGCHCGVVVVVKYILYTFLDPCLYFTWTTLIIPHKNNLVNIYN